jgi:ketosteroid isomerase-like protein
VTEKFDQDLLSRRNVELMRKAYEGVGRDDFQPAFDLVVEDVVVHDRPEVPDAATYRGREGMITALRSSDDSFEDFRLVPEDLIGVGDHHVVVVLRMSGRGRGSGVPVEETIAHLWTLRDGKAVELQVYSDPEDALRDARAGRG